MANKHPGRTPAMRRALDQIGVGNYSPFMADRTREALLSDGLIEEIAPLMLGGRFPIKVRQFQMPIPVHMQWCQAVAEDEE